VDIRDAAACYRAVASRDRRFDGMFYTAVRSTGIYCRPSCPARTPLPGNVSFHRTAAAAQAAGYRACKRCLPDAAPGSPAWDLAADTVGRAMRLIADGVVEREGVEGLARRLGYTTRHLNRLLTAELGAGPLALARAQRAQNARLLIERTDWRLADVAFAAGFASVRQFNDTMREVYATTPKELRSRPASDSPGGGSARLEIRLPVRTPFDARSLWRFLDAHLVAGVEATGEGWYARTLRLPHGPGTLRLDLDQGTTGPGQVRQVPCTLRVSDLRDVAAAIERCRRLLDADCDPIAVDAALAGGPLLGPLVAARPGLRVPGHVDGHELALRTVLGQQVSVTSGNRLGSLLADRCPDPLPETLWEHGLDRLFPAADVVATLDPEELPMPRARGAALVGLAAALAAGDVALDRSADRAETRARLLALPGIGPWSADYVVMRALGDPDVFLPTDVAVRRALGALGGQTRTTDSASWRPWRSYALVHLWTHTAWARTAWPQDTQPPARKEP
jgi:AraC family transcriptional regulator, regulatory protein of adaptative response / DNA-3-methyladenine glycosylase II